MTIELSADLGELSPGEEEIWPLVDAANVACGGHVGDESTMKQAARRARELHVRLGAHPSYPDREHFGRRSLQMPHDELRASLASQIATLRDIAIREGVTLAFVKPHGALYNDAHRDAALARVIVDAMRDVDPQLAIVCPAHSEMARAGARVIAEAFADRRYNADGSLVPRAETGSLLNVDEAVAQAELLANERAVIARDGSRIAIELDTICIHADMEHALERLRAIRAALHR